MSKPPYKHGWLPALMTALLLVLDSQPTLAQGFTPCDSVPEASSYDLVYVLPIPSSADYNNLLPPYSVDNTASTGSFDRVAYCVELDNQWVWVSLDAFTSVPAQLGVPVTSTGAVFQQTVSNMNVESNVPGIVTGTGITTGNIEFWHHCYVTGNEIGIPGASGSVYDFGDDNRHNASCYGSMQLHNYGAGQTLFAYNRWDGGGTSDLGIGNSPTGHPDWTFRVNAGTYAVRNMYILVTSGDADADGDGVPDSVDICPGGDDNVDTDGDGVPDYCDACPLDAANDVDDDGICESDDNCPLITNDNQADLDGDGAGDVCDDDIDGDGVLNADDNCAFDVNADQSDLDGDGAGDVCDADIDGDSVVDAGDACVPSPVNAVVNTDGCAISDLCPCAHPDGSDRWKNHGAYVSCVAHTANDFVDAGLVTEMDQAASLSAAGSSTCGHKNK